MAVQQPAFPELEGPDFVRSSEVEAVGAKVLELHGGVGAPLHEVAVLVGEQELRILWLLNEKPFTDAEDDQQPEIAGRCVKAPKLWHDVTGVDYAIWVRAHFWNDFGTELRRAVLLHELEHIEIKRDANGIPKFGTRKHDVEDFVDVARHYGPSALAGFGGQYVRAAMAFAGEPAPIATGRKPRPVARDAGKPGDKPRELAHEFVDAVGEAAGVAPEVLEESHRQIDATAERLAAEPEAPQCGLLIEGGFPCAKPAGHVAAGDPDHDDLPF